MKITLAEAHKLTEESSKDKQARIELEGEGLLERISNLIRGAAVNNSNEIHFKTALDKEVVDYVRLQLPGFIIAGKSYPRSNPPAEHEYTVTWPEPRGETNEDNNNNS